MTEYERSRVLPARPPARGIAAGPRGGRTGRPRVAVTAG